MKRNPEGFVWIVSWILFLSCSIALFSLGYKCLEKYWKRPQSVEISTHPQFELDLPAFTVCPNGQVEADPPPLNITNLEMCGLTYKDLLNGTFKGSGTSECEDPKKFWEIVNLKPQDFGISIYGITFIDAQHLAPIDENDPIWEKKLVLDGLKWDIKMCYTIKLPKELTTIREFFLGVKSNKSFQFYMHHPGLLNIIPWSTLEYNMVTFDSNVGSIIDVMYSQRIMLPSETTPCYTNLNFSPSEDMIVQVEKVLQIKSNCFFSTNIIKFFIAEN